MIVHRGSRFQEVAASYKFRCYPTLDQETLLIKTFGCVRVVYNRARAMREGAWASRRENAGFTQSNAMLTELKKGPEFAWLNEVSSIPLQQCLRHLDVAYRGFFRKTARYPKFRNKHGRQSAEFTRSGFKYQSGSLTLAKMTEPLRVAWSRNLPSHPRTVTVSRDADGRWFVALTVSVTIETFVGGGEVGVDLGLKDIATLSNGEKVGNPRHTAKRQTKLARLQRSLAKKQKGSKNRTKARVRVARVVSAVKNSRLDFLHKLSTRLIRENQTVCVETLSIKGMLKAKLHSKSIADAGWGELVRMLTYKAAWYGRDLVKIDRFFPSTKTCSACGTTGHCLTLSDRVWTCIDCGTTHDRDVNASINILAAGLAVAACGEVGRPGDLRASGQVSVKQEPDLRWSGN